MSLSRVSARKLLRDSQTSKMFVVCKSLFQVPGSWTANAVLPCYLLWPMLRHGGMLGKLFYHRRLPYRQNARTHTHICKHTRTNTPAHIHTRTDKQTYTHACIAVAGTLAFGQKRMGTCRPLRTESWRRRGKWCQRCAITRSRPRYQENSS
jgi:hypothetical protein